MYIIDTDEHVSSAWWLQSRASVVDVQPNEQRNDSDTQRIVYRQLTLQQDVVT
jgi:hypothetical protein